MSRALSDFDRAARRPRRQPGWAASAPRSSSSARSAATGLAGRSSRRSGRTTSSSAPRRVAGRPTGRIGVLVEADGERSFVADRGAADRLAPADLRAAWFKAVEVVHLPLYSLVGEPLGSAGREAVRLARDAGAAVSLDLASVGPLLGARPAGGAGARPGGCARRPAGDGGRALGAARFAQPGGPRGAGPGLRPGRHRQARWQRRDGPSARRHRAPRSRSTSRRSRWRPRTRPAPATRSTRAS